MIDEATPGRQPVTIVQIDQPFCSNTFGTAPCTATGAAGAECYNTFGTCQDKTNFSRSTKQLYFSDGSAGCRLVGVDADKYVIPSLVSVSTSPTKINLSGANPNATGLGNRAVCSITFQDHPDTDRSVDPYVSTRGHDQLKRGSFWSKWFARNKYRQNILITIYEGYSGQLLSEMMSRKYFLQSVSGPDSSGRVKITGKDILARLEERKSNAPSASPGVLYANISESDMTLDVVGAVLSDYPASGTIRIGSELIKYTSTVLSVDKITFTLSERGSDGSIAATHSQKDAVQECVRYENAKIYDVLQDLLVSWSGIDQAYLNTPAWAVEFDTHLPAYRLTTVISEPTAVSKLVADLQIECQFYAWWDERSALVNVRAIRGVDAGITRLTEESNILENSLSIVEKPEQRASQVWIYHTVRDYTNGINDVNRYKSTEVVANLSSEGINEYGEPSVRKIYSRFLQSSALAFSTATRILNRYSDAPRICEFALDAKDRKIWVGDTVEISHRIDVDETGARKINRWTITSAEEFIAGDKIRYTAEDTTVYGLIRYIMPAGSGDYQGYDVSPDKNCYIGDAAGLLSDGAQAGRIS